jgi:hypothetical protein
MPSSSCVLIALGRSMNRNVIVRTGFRQIEVIVTVMKEGSLMP